MAGGNWRLFLSRHRFAREAGRENDSRNDRSVRAGAADGHAIGDEKLTRGERDGLRRGEYAGGVEANRVLFRDPWRNHLLRRG
jgi:hypothetical protein